MNAIAHAVLAAGRKTIATGKALVGDICRALADERRNRALIEKEIYHGRYKLSSKNDDDLPVVR